MDYRTTIDGLTVYQARKISNYAFGDFHYITHINAEECRFDVILYETITDEEEKTIEIDPVTLEDFKKFWGPNWNIIKVPKEVISVYKK